MENESKNGSNLNVIKLDGKEYPINIEALTFTQKGLDNYYLKNFKTAIEYFSKAISITNENPNLYLFRGTSAEDSGDYDNALIDYKKAYDLNQNSSLICFRIGMIYGVRKDFETACEWLLRSYANCPDIPEEIKLIKERHTLFNVDKKVICNNLGNYLAQMGYIDESLHFFDEAIKIDPNYPHPYVIKGILMYRMGNKEEAISLVKKAYTLGMTQVTDLINRMSRNEKL